jgi:excisionase family DNA binding protein
VNRLPKDADAVEVSAPAVLSIRQLARYLRVGFYAARGLVESGAIPARKIGPTWRITRKSADEFLEGKQTTRTDDRGHIRLRLEAVRRLRTLDESARMR